MNFEQAVKSYTEQAGIGNGVVLQPNRKLSEVKCGRWIMRNTNGFLAYVTSTGKVLDSRFQQIKPC